MRYRSIILFVSHSTNFRQFFAVSINFVPNSDNMRRMKIERVSFIVRFNVGSRYLCFAQVVVIVVHLRMVYIILYRIVMYEYYTCTVCIHVTATTYLRSYVRKRFHDIDELWSVNFEGYWPKTFDYNVVAAAVAQYHYTNVFFFFCFSLQTTRIFYFVNDKLSQVRICTNAGYVIQFRCKLR